MARTYSRLRLLIGTTIALIALVASAAPVAAVHHDTSGSHGSEIVCYQQNCWSGSAIFFADWERIYRCEEGTCYWDFDNLQMSGGIVNGKNCAVNVCATWTASFKATFKTAGGTTVTSFYPPNGACYAEAWASSTRVWVKCKTNFTVPITASQIKFEWTINVTNPYPDTIVATWNDTKTVTI